MTAKIEAAARAGQANGRLTLGPAHQGTAPKVGAGTKGATALDGVRRCDRPSAEKPGQKLPQEPS